MWIRWWTSGFHKMLGSSRVAAQLAASQEGLSSLSEWVITDTVTSQNIDLSSGDTLCSNRCGALRVAWHTVRWRPTYFTAPKQSERCMWVSWRHTALRVGIGHNTVHIPTHADRLPAIPIYGCDAVQSDRCMWVSWRHTALRVSIGHNTVHIPTHAVRLPAIPIYGCDAVQSDGSLPTFRRDTLALLLTLKMQRARSLKKLYLPTTIFIDIAMRTWKLATAVRDFSVSRPSDLRRHISGLTPCSLVRVYQCFERVTIFRLLYPEEIRFQ
jgi:hypothetical protein